MSMIRKLRRAPDRSLNFLKRNSVSGYFQSQKMHELSFRLPFATDLFITV